MGLYSICQTHFPYVIQQQSCGGYLFLNREYSPIGSLVKFAPRDWVEPVRLKITPRVAALLSVHKKRDTHDVVLYHDGCIPGSSPEATKAYFRRLGILFDLRVQNFYPGPAMVGPIISISDAVRSLLTK